MQSYFACKDNGNSEERILLDLVINEFEETLGNLI